MIAPFHWDKYSDQPAQLQERAYKRSMRKKELFSLLKTFGISLIVLPLSLVLMPFTKKKNILSRDFFCVGVDFEREPHKSCEYIQELGVNSILLRFKLWEMDKLEELKKFLVKNAHLKITLKILQDRQNIENTTLLRKNLLEIFSQLHKEVSLFEIGSTINRAKWGFFSVNEYLRFYQVAYDLKEEKFPHIQLIGSGVIDFEYHFSSHSLFHFSALKYDGVASLLYVDRRGSPESNQIIFNLLDKIAWLSSMVWLSPKTSNKLYITETNWPLSNTAPYAPTSEYECVSEALYEEYMLRYYLLAFASQQVNFVSWHQLIASGYGLIDEREGLRKRKAFYVYKFMVQTLKNAQFLRLDIHRSHYIFQALIDEKLLQIHWSLQKISIKNEDFYTIYSSEGKLLSTGKNIEITSTPLYIFIEDSLC